MVGKDEDTINSFIDVPLSAVVVVGATKCGSEVEGKMKTPLVQ